VRLESESYGDPETARFIEENFVPFTVNLSEKASLFGRFDAAWTPTVLILSSKGKERWRLEGYHDREEFHAWMVMGLARVEFMGKRFANAEKWYEHVATKHPQSHYAPEAMYWRAVCQYNQSHDPAPLMQVAQDLHSQHPDSIWTMKTAAWMPGGESDQRKTA
jgi:hypothetical protein